MHRMTGSSLFLEQVVYTALKSDKAAMRKLGIDMLMTALRPLSPQDFSRFAAPHMQSISLCMPTRATLQHLIPNARACHQQPR